MLRKVFNTDVLLDLVWIVVVVILYASLLSGCASVPRGRTVEEQYLAAAELHVSCGPPGTDRTDKLMHGSAVIVSEYRAITAAHVLGCTVNGAMLKLADGREVQVKIEAVSEKLDAARLVADQPLGTLPVEVGRAVEGDIVCITTRWPKASRRCGEVRRAELDSLIEILHAATTEPGNSGSGLYDRRGRLVGIATRKVNLAIGGGVASIVRRWFIEPR